MSTEDKRSSHTLEWHLLSDLRMIATEQIAHNYAGMCPDLLEGPSVRDASCPACQILVRADVALANGGLQ